MFGGAEAKEKEKKEEIHFATTNQTEHNYRDNNHGRLPEKAHAHRGWPPMVINSAQYKISGSPRATCKHKSITM